MTHRFPDSAVFYRKLRHEFPLAVRAEGSWIEDDRGRRWLDASGGAVVANLGHGGPLAGGNLDLRMVPGFAQVEGAHEADVLVTGATQIEECPVLRLANIDAGVVHGHEEVVPRLRISGGA